MGEGAPTTLATLRTRDGGSVPASQDGFSACSRYFEALFYDPLSNPCQGDYEIRGVSTTSLQAIVAFCTTGLVEITVDNVQEFTAAAGQLLVDISRNMGVDNNTAVLEFAKFYHLTIFFKRSFSFLLENIEFANSVDPEFSQPSLEHLEDRLDSDELKVRREKVAWKVAMLWVEANYRERRRRLGTLLPLVRFGLMSRRYLREVVMRNAFIDGDTSFKVERCYDLKTSGQNVRPSDSVRRLFVHMAPTEILFLCKGVWGGPKSGVWEQYNHKINEGSPLRAEFTAQTVFGPEITFMGDTIHVLGTDLNKHAGGPGSPGDEERGAFSRAGYICGDDSSQGMKT
ncbi:kelch-like protein 10 [Haemaphysalis longicornis]